MMVTTFYKVLSKQEFSTGLLTLRSIRPEDIEKIRVWRNTQIHVLRQKYQIDKEGQQSYFESQVWPEMSSLRPSKVLFSIDQNEEMIGYGGLVHISWEDKRAEVSFLLDPEIERDSKRKELVLGKFLDLLRFVAFRELKLNRLFTETFSFRTRHIRILEKSGFRHEGTLRSHILIDSAPYDSLIHGVLSSEWSPA